ncbi:unnamed protein product [Lasius platythorax]|uniref:Uncharacterized protein n=1 Tax=Lasius platythorax TaxID=488582 RepID=A0AAV2MYW5_9HYME
MRELGRIIRLYAHDSQTTWDRVVERAERTINGTSHRNTSYAPCELHRGMRRQELQCDPRLRSTEDGVHDREAALRERLQVAARTLQRRAEQRKRQTDRHGEAERYDVGTSVWVKLHRRSDANRRLTRKIHLVYEGPYVILREIRRNAYLVGQRDGTAIGTYNSRQLRPHRVALLRPGVVRVDAMSCVRRNERRRSKSSNYSNESSEVMFSDSSAASDEPDSVEVLHDIPEDLSRAKPVCGVSSARADGTASLGKSLKPRYKPVSEKGLRHIKRIFRVLRGESRVLSAEGRLEDRSVRVLFDMRGDFDVVTTAAVAYPSGGRMRLEYIENPHNVPAYLKAQRHVRVQAVNCKITIKGRSMELQPMLLRGQDPMVLLGRHASTSFLLRISRRPGAKLSRRVLLHRGKQIIQRWMEADSRERQPSQEASQLSSSGGRSDETAGAATTREDTRAANDSDQENVPTKEDAASRRKRATSSSGYFSSAQWREMWSSEEETDARREEKTGDVHTQITEEDSEVAKKFVKFVSYLRDLPVSDFTKKNIVEEDSSDEPEKENASMSDAETVRIIEETSCEIIDTRDGNSVDSFNEKVVINVDDSQVTFNESAVLTLPADTGVGNGAVGIIDRHFNLTEVPRMRADECSLSRDADTCAAIATELIETKDFDRQIFGEPARGTRCRVPATVSAKRIPPWRRSYARGMR